MILMTNHEEEMDIEIKREKGLTRLVVDGDIDEQGAEILNERFHAMEKTELKGVVLDFQRVGYIGSSGIGQLILIYKNMATSGGTVRIENARKAVYDLLVELHIDKVIEVSRA